MVIGFIVQKDIYVHNWFVAWQLFNASSDHYAAPQQ
jgi:hypothetical protein